MTMIDGEVTSKMWPLSVPFVISRSRRTEVELVCLRLHQSGFSGCGECSPNERYQETTASEVAKIKAVLARQSPDQPLEELVQNMRPGAAKNAIDCALWDLTAKQQGQRVWQLMGLDEPKPFTSVYTISLGHPDMMAAAALSAINRGCHHLKLKGGGEGDKARVRAVRAIAPDAKIIIDANESWQAKHLSEYLKVMAGEGVALVEQPLPAKQDNALSAVKHLVPICADESCLTVEDIPRVAKLYDFINIKLDKAGGLTAAIELQNAAFAHDLGIMVGCMLGTSLAMAPATLLANKAKFIDLDGPFLLKEDYTPALMIEGSTLYAPKAELWG
jgi:L-Ala-D/L-Glu epimerase